MYLMDTGINECVSRVKEMIKTPGRVFGAVKHPDNNVPHPVSEGSV